VGKSKTIIEQIVEGSDFSIETMEKTCWFSAN